MVKVDDAVYFDSFTPEAEPYFSIRKQCAQIQLHPAVQPRPAKSVEKTVRFMPAMRPKPGQGPRQIGIGSARNRIAIRAKAGYYAK